MPCALPIQRPACLNEAPASISRSCFGSAEPVRNCRRRGYFTSWGRSIGYSFQLAITATLYTIIVYCIATAQSWINWSCLWGMLERKFHRGLGPVICRKWLFILLYSTWDSLCKLICTRRRRCLANISFNYYYNSIKEHHLGTNIVKHWLDFLPWFVYKRVNLHLRMDGITLILV